ncbi:MAG: acyltransferase [Bacteroidales bacterium]|nr:acyltransferase [Bacteroidales bacterium]
MLKREVISIAKGLMIIAMVIGHSYAPVAIKGFMCMFRMPLFFLCSGYCLKPEYQTDIRLYLKKRTKRLYWPFVKYTLFFMLLHVIFCQTEIFHIGGQGCVYDGFSFVDYLKMLCKVVLKMDEPEHLLGGFWFLRELFIASLMFAALSLVSVKKSALYVALLALVGLYMLFSVYDLKFYVFTKKTFLSCVFYFIGFLLRPCEFKKSGRLLFASFVVTCVVACFFPLTMDTKMTYLVVPCIAFALVGSFMALEVSMFIQSYNGALNRFLVYVGNHTLWIFVYHLVSMKLVSLFLIQIYHLEMSHIADYPTIKSEYVQSWGWMLYTIVGVGVPLALVYCKERLLSPRK